MAVKLLLVEDVESLGNSGELVNVRPGYARNYLLPNGYAVIATEGISRFQEKLKEERHKKVVVDRQESEALKARLDGVTVNAVVKVDHEGHMYGSVTAAEIIHLLQAQHEFVLEKKMIQLKHPIKETGVHPIPVKLKEGVAASFNLKVMSEEGHQASLEEVPSAPKE